MDIAITGASGLIGSALRRQLTHSGHRVVAVVRGQSQPDSIRWDPAAASIDAVGFEGLDAVVHLAGEGIANKRWSPEQRILIEGSRTEGTTLLADTLASLHKPPAIMLSGSAIGYYGDRGDQILTENSSPATDFLGQMCQRWEAATAPAEEAGIRVAHLRTGLVLAPNGGALGKMLPLFKFGFGGRLGNGRQYWSWISIDDVVGAISWLLLHNVSGAVNLTAPNPVTNGEFTTALAAAVNRPAIFPVPRFGPRLLLGTDLADALLFSSARVQPEVLSSGGYQFSQPEVTKALAAIVNSTAKAKARDKDAP